MRELYKQNDLPIFQNRMYEGEQVGRTCPKGQMRLVRADRAFGGQYLRIIGDLSTVRQPMYDPLHATDFPADSLDSTTQVTQLAAQAAVCGGATKEFIFSLFFLEPAGCKVERIIDIPPAKQKQFLPGNGLRGLSPEEGRADLPEGNVIQVMNPNSLDEIRESSPTHLQYKVL